MGAKTKSRKITLREAVAQGCTDLLFYCNAIGCGHEGMIPLDSAVVRWKLKTRLDEIHAVCSACGSRDVDVRPGWPVKGPGGI